MLCSVLMSHYRMYNSIILFYDTNAVDSYLYFKRDVGDCHVCHVKQGGIKRNGAPSYPPVFLTHSDANGFPFIRLGLWG